MIKRIEGYEVDFSRILVGKWKWRFETSKNEYDNIVRGTLKGAERNFSKCLTKLKKSWQQRLRLSDEDYKKLYEK